MTPDDYINLICKPHVEEFATNPTSIAQAWAAVVSLGQFGDYLAAHRGISKTQARSIIRDKFSQYDLVIDIANASKHFEVDDPNRTNRPGFSVGHLRIGKSSAFSDGSFFSDGTSFAEHPDVIRADYQNEHHDLLHLCESCLETLRQLG